MSYRSILLKIIWVKITERNLNKVMWIVNEGDVDVCGRSNMFDMAIHVTLSVKGVWYVCTFVWVWVVVIVAFPFHPASKLKLSDPGVERMDKQEPDGTPMVGGWEVLFM